MTDDGFHSSQPFLHAVDRPVRGESQFLHTEGILDPRRRRFPQYRGRKVIMDPRPERLEKSGFYIGPHDQRNTGSCPVKRRAQGSEHSASVRERGITKRDQRPFFFQTGRRL